LPLSGNADKLLDRVKSMKAKYYFSSIRQPYRSRYLVKYIFKYISRYTTVKKRVWAGIEPEAGFLVLPASTYI
jgi:hypothetical protein